MADARTHRKAGTTYEAQYHTLTKTDLVHRSCSLCSVGKTSTFFAGSIVLAIAACALSTSGRFGPTGQPNPGRSSRLAPKPDYFFLWLYALLSLLPPSMETPFLNHRHSALVILGFDPPTFSYWRRGKELETPPDREAHCCC